MMLRWRMSLLGLLGITLALGGAPACNGDDDDDVVVPPPPVPPPPAGATRLRVVHASPNAPAVDVWTPGATEPLVRELRYGQTTPYIDVPAGDATFLLRASPSTATDPVAFSTGVVSLPADRQVTAVAAGLLGSEDPETSFRVLPLVEGFGPNEPGKARVRVVHASPNAPTVGVDVGAVDPAAPEIPSLPRFGDTGPDGIPLDAAQMLQLGITADNQRVTAFTTPALPDGGELFVIATGLLGDAARRPSGFSLLPVAQTGALDFVLQNPRVFALHASPDAPAVDLFFQDMELVDDLTFGELSQTIQVPPGTYMIDVFPTAPGNTRPAGAPVAMLSTGDLVAGESYLGIATGFVAAARQSPLQLLRFQEAFAEQGPRLRAVHASPDAPPVDVGVVADGELGVVLIEGLAFTQATPPEGLQVPPGNYVVGLAPAGNPTQVVFSQDLSVEPTTASFVVAAGALQPQDGEQPLQLIGIDTRAPVWQRAAVPPQ